MKIRIGRVVFVFMLSAFAFLAGYHVGVNPNAERTVELLQLDQNATDNPASVAVDCDVETVLCYGDDWGEGSYSLIRGD